MMKTRAFILLFFLFAAGCTVQLYPPVKKVEPLPPAKVDPVSVTPDGGIVIVNGDAIPQAYSGRKRFYWEQIEQSDSTQSFAVTNGAKDGRWVRGDSMRWHTSGPFITVMTDTVATRAYARANGGGGDNLGNHIATQNIQLDTNYISSDGDNEGFSVNASGHITHSAKTTLSDTVYTTGSRPVEIKKVNTLTWSANELTAFSLEQNESGKVSSWNTSGGLFIKGVTSSGTNPGVGLYAYTGTQPTTWGNFMVNTSVHDGAGSLIPVADGSPMVKFRNSFSDRFSLFGNGDLVLQDGGDTSALISVNEVAFPQIGYMSADSVVVVNSQNRIGKMAVADIGGTMSTFSLAADSGTPETVTNAETVTTSGGYGINTSIAATNTTTVTADSSELSTVYAVGDSLSRRFRNVYQCEDYGAHVDTTDNSPKIQAAIDAAAANGGGIVKLTTPGVYTVASAGASCYTNNACIIMKDSIDFVLGAGVTLKLAADQWNDTGTVRVVVIAVCDASDFSISGGKIDGNAGAQSTWTGGYEQAKAFGIQVYRCNSFEVRDMTIMNGLANPVNFHSCYEGEVVNMYSTQNGEGPEWQRCWDFDVRNFAIDDSTDVAVGDGFELSGCHKFTINGIRVSENGLGAAIDLYGSRDIVLSNFLIENWDGVGISYNNPTGFLPLNINISDGVIRGNKTQNGIQPNGNPGGSSTISNVVFDSLQFGIYMLDNAQGYTIADDCVFKSNLVGVRMECNDTLSLKSSLFTDNTYAIQFDVHPTYTQPVLIASDCDLIENSTAFYYSGDGTNIFTPKFYMDGLHLLNNTSEITYSAIAANDTTTWRYGDYYIANQMKLGGYGRGDFSDTDNAFFITIDEAGNRQEMAMDSLFLYSPDYKRIEANTAGSGTPNALTNDEAGKVLTNEGSTAQNYHTLPTAAAGLTYTFVVQDSDGIRIVANTGDTIRVAGTVSASAGYTESTTIGDVITLVAINATEWIAVSYVGTWTTI